MGKKHYNNRIEKKKKKGKMRLTIVKKAQKRISNV
jgi:hypothetical protein